MYWTFDRYVYTLQKKKRKLIWGCMIFRYGGITIKVFPFDLNPFGELVRNQAQFGPINK